MSRIFVRSAMEDISWSNCWVSASGILLRRSVARSEQSEMDVNTQCKNLGSCEGEFVRLASRWYLSVTVSRACRIVLLLVWC